MEAGTIAHTILSADPLTLPPAIDWQTAGIGPGSEVPVELRVTRDNWRLYPYSRWAFQHSRELVPSRNLLGTPSPRPLPMRRIALDHLRFDDGSGQSVSWADFEERTYCDAMLVLQNGHIVHERYLNGMTAETPHHSFSVTKSLVGLLAELLIAEGSVDPDDLTSCHVPELGGGAFAETTVRQLLDMVDGVAFDENYADPDAAVHRYSANYWTPSAARGGVRSALTELVDRAHAPGKGFAYRSPVADVLGWVLVRASGMRLADLFAARLWQPAGCAGPGHFLVDVAGDEIAASGLNATARDMARLALLLAEGQSIPPAVRASIGAGGNRAHFAASSYASRTKGSYRSMWWVSHDDPASVAALGVFGQRVHIDMTGGLIVVRFGSHPLASSLHTDDLHRRAIDALRGFLDRTF